MKITEECKLCGGVGRVVILVPNVAPEKGKVYSDCPCCIERIWTADEAKLNARIAELERQLVESRDFAISEAAKIRAEYEAQQAVLVEALTEYMAAYNEHWERGMPILEPMGDSALAAVKPAGQKGSE